MTNPIFKYIPERSCLEEQPRMINPSRSGWMTHPGITLERYKARYNEHIASLRTYHTEFKGWGEGELIEGKHFKLDEGTVVCYGMYSAMEYKAIPILQPKDDPLEELYSKTNTFSSGVYLKLEDVKEFLSQYKISKRI